MQTVYSRLLTLLAAAFLALTAASANAADPGECALAGQVATRDWKAWNDLMPPKPDYLHVIGEIEVPNPGVEPLLRPSEPQGRNPLILILDLYLCQMPGMWTQALTWKPVRFDTEIDGSGYTQVHIIGDNADFGFIDAGETQ